MLTIPESVKTLFKTDGVRKNFRAHFPNGELDDIINANVVRESLHFTESLCSQSVFKFGLAEASVIEFETVGVGNMYGMSIECGIEIDTSSLSAAQISAIQADSGDGTLVPAADSDIGWGFYRVPLGIFRVESCPRNHGAMTHRKVTAYGGDADLTSPVMDFMLKCPSTKPTLNFKSAEDFAAANFGWFSPQYVQSNYTASIYQGLNASRDFEKHFVLSTGTLKLLFSTAETYWGPHTVVDNRIVDMLFSVSRGNFDGTAFHDDISGMLDTLGITDDQDRATVLEYADYVSAFRIESVRWATTANENEDYFERLFFPITQDIPIGDMPYGLMHGIIVPNSINMTYIFAPAGGTSVRGHTARSFNPSTPPVVYDLSRNGTPSAIPMSIAKTGGFVWGGMPLFTFIESLDINKFVNGYLEADALFANLSRTGNIRFVALNDAAPVLITPGDFDDLWWDEYDVSPIGTVTVTVQSGNEQNTADLSIGRGASIYDMTNNEFLKVLETVSLASINTLLNGTFKTNAQNVGFTPAELTMQGWPWLEAGDALEITAEDGSIVDTFALRIEMDGIQQLTATITAEGGEIVGEV